MIALAHMRGSSAPCQTYARRGRGDLTRHVPFVCVGCCVAEGGALLDVFEGEDARCAVGNRTLRALKRGGGAVCAGLACTHVLLVYTRPLLSILFFARLSPPSLSHLYHIHSVRILINNIYVLYPEPARDGQDGRPGYRCAESYINIVPPSQAYSIKGYNTYILTVARSQAYSIPALDPLALTLLIFSSPLTASPSAIRASALCSAPGRMRAGRHASTSWICIVTATDGVGFTWEQSLISHLPFQ
jgi:hypothetical protein